MSVPLHVLVLEDSEDDAELIVHELLAHGFEPHWDRVHTPEAFVASLDEHKWDVILADYNLPRFSAPAALEIIKERGLDVPFIIVSGHLRDIDAVKSMRAGAHDFFSKNNLSRLPAAVEREMREARIRNERREAFEELGKSVERARFLAAASAALSETLELNGVVEKVAGLAVPFLGDYAQVTLRERDGSLRPAAVAPPDRQIESSLRAALDAAAASAAESSWTRSLSDPGPNGHSLLSLPLPSVRHGVLGALVILARSRSDWSMDDRGLAEELARRAAGAIENAILFRRVQEAMREAQDAVRARDEFLSIAAHELRTPLTPLKLHLDSMFKLLPPSGAGVFRSKLESARRQTVRLAKLVESLLDVSRLTSGRFDLALDEFDLGELVQEVCERYHGEAERVGSSMQCRIDSPVMGRWDRLRLEQVLSNLISNAIKYGAGQPVMVEVNREGALARINVEDRGIGIDDRDLDRIFGRFERAVSPRHYGGLGLGLFIARQIVEAHGGSISVRSSVGYGARFVVQLPVSPRAVTAPSEASRPPLVPHPLP